MSASTSTSASPRDVHVPDFARRPYEPFSRTEAIAIALREWRLFGQIVDDGPPEGLPQYTGESRPQRQPGMWERVGEYWFLSQEPDSKYSAWTGKHDEYGVEFSPSENGNFAWSAAFISYVMRTAGAGSRFPYAPNHATYINAAREGYGVLQAQRPEVYAPAAGDLICLGRGRSSRLKFDDLPAPSFPGHCDLVVARRPGELTVVGGNVDSAVTMKHVPTTADGMIATPDGTNVDSRYPWFVILRVAYDR